MSLPADVVYHIFSFLSPCEIVRLRQDSQVSRNFRDITHSQVLWKDIYANARSLRPPGPYSWQSTRYLKRILVQSELVSKTWTSQPLRMLSRTSSCWKWNRRDSKPWTVVFGRWCIFSQGKTIQCHDIDSNAYRSLYDGADGPSFVFVPYTASAADIGGHWAYLLLIINADQEDKFRLLAFRVNDDGFSEPEIMDCINLAPRLFDGRRCIDFRGSAPFITLRSIHPPPLVFDHRTRCFYTLPSPQIPDDLAHETQVYSAMRRPWYTHTEIVLTKTHIIAVWTSGASSNMIVLIRAFIVPGSALPHNIGELRLTHEAIIHASSYLCRFSLLRNSIVNPVTGSVNIRLLNVTIPRTNREQKHMSCLDLTLPKPVSNTDDVLPISVHTQHLFESTWTYEHHSISDDGYGLGLLLTETRPSFIQINSARKFAIDASKEECTLAVGDPCPIPVEYFHVAFDGTRGRLHYFQWDENDDDVNRVVTVDLA